MDDNLDNPDSTRGMEPQAEATTHAKPAELTQVELRAGDGAVILRADGDVELFVPKPEFAVNAPDVMHGIGMCSILLADTAFSESIRTIIRAHVQSAYDEIKSRAH